MADPTTTLNVMAAVRRDNGGFACVVRWMLGTGDDLPNTDDVFDVTLNLLEQDGTFVREIARAAVSPRLFVMIDPPREPRPLDYPGGDTLQWLVAVKPQKGIDCAAADPGTLDGSAFGVCHLLSETEPSRVEWRAARVLYQAMSRRGLAASRFRAVVGDRDLEASARTFARTLMQSRVRPVDLRPRLEASFTQLVAAARGTAGASAAVASSLLHLPGADPSRQFAYAALVVDALADREVMNTLDTTTAPPSQMRQHVRLRVLHGGEFIDYWADPDGSGGSISEPDRGKRLPASEMIGCGARFAIDAAALGEWVQDKRTLAATVTMRTRLVVNRHDRPLDALERGEKPGNVVHAQARGHFDAGTWPMDFAQLKRAQLKGSSAPPVPPAGARVNYAMYQSDAARSDDVTFETDHGPTLGYSTGDGRVEIVIDPPDRSAMPQSSVGGFNVYGMWEGLTATAPFFADPSKNPTLAELRPWLITRRYSYIRDLKEAFPPVTGHPHPALKSALGAPPWQPVLLAPGKVLDQTRNEELPSLVTAGGTAFAFDLRKGMSNGDDGGLFFGWDPAAPASVLWSPEKLRDGTPLPGTATHPQRYRFWVTAVDAFDQESDPVPVRTDDADTGTSISQFLFSPLRRAPLLGPPGGNQDFKWNLAFDANTKRLTATFETPLENRVAGRLEAEPPARVDKTTLSAVMVVWRRRLTRKIDTGSNVNVRALFAAATIPDLPQWVDADAALRADGWRRFAVLSATPPASGDVWTASTTIDLEGIGWEYQAGVGFIVPDNRATFWTPNVLAQGGASGRLAVLAERQGDGSYKPRPARVNETPRASDVALTNVVAIPNEARARGVVPGASRVWPAAPVPAPPGIRRDLVLLRLLTNDFADGGVRLPRTPWRDSGAELTVGQAAMNDTALTRTPVEGAPIPLDDPRLQATRSALAAAFAAKDTNGTPLRQHPTLGFRGLVDLRWHYVPLAVRPATPQSPEAEAVRFRIYGIRAPQEQGETFATAAGAGQLMAADRYSITLTKGDPDGWATVAVHNVPTVVRIIASDGTQIDADLMDAGGDAQKSIRIARRPQDVRPLPQNATLQLFAAQPITEVDTSDFDVESDYRLLLPIGGGDPDVFAWWIVGLSAQGKEALRLPAAAVERFVGTIEPPAPRAFQVSTPTDFTAHRLSPGTTFTPTDLVTEDDAKFSPRLVLTWEAAPASFGLAVIVEREERRAATPTSSLLRALAVSPWQAIQAIEGIPEGADIDVGLLDAITGNWLLGKIVDVEGTPTEVYEHIGRDPKRRLDATRGLKIVPSQEPSDPGTGARRMRPAFIDYFGRNRDAALVMDANWEFRYRLRFFTDLGDKLPPEWRFLLSRPTDRSPWLLPETTPLTVTKGDATTQELETLHAPQIRFVLKPRTSVLLRAMQAVDDLAFEHRWEFRAVVRRRLGIPLLNTGEQPDVWIDVGSPVRLQGSQTAELVDAEVERGWPGDQPQLDYRIVVQQFLIVETGEGDVERLVRGFDVRQPNVGNCDVSITIAAPSRPSREVEMRQVIEIV